MAWQIQTATKPLFPDLLWDQPQRRDQLPLICVVGGQSQALGAPLGAYQRLKDRARLKIVVPEACRRLLGSPGPEIIFVPSNRSGGLARGALEDIVRLSADADSLLIGGDLGANSQTLALVGSILGQVGIPTVISGDGWRAWGDQQLPEPHQILVGEGPVVDRYLRGWDDFAKKIPPSRPVWQAILADERLDRLNLVCNRWQTNWVKVGRQMCYNQELTVSPRLDLAVEIAFYGALYPQRLFAAGATVAIAV